MVKGVCNCGSVKFEVNSHLEDIYFCHCSICRKSTGSGGIAVVIVPITNFSWVTGQDQITKWSKPEHDWNTSFCKCCGSPLPDNDSESNMYVPAGLLSEGTEMLKVAHHIWVDSKADWEIIGDTGKQHGEACNAKA